MLLGIFHGMIGGTVIILVLMFLYLVPTFIAAARHTQNRITIFNLNLLIGWTLIGWVVALSGLCLGTQLSLPHLFLPQPSLKLQSRLERQPSPRNLRRICAGNSSTSPLESVKEAGGPHTANAVQCSVAGEAEPHHSFVTRNLMAPWSKVASSVSGPTIGSKRRT